MHDRDQRPRRGGNAVEFALTLPVFCLLVLGLCDYGYLFMISAGLDQAATLGCREGAITDPNMGDPIANAKSAISQMSALFCDGGPACTVTVTQLSAAAYAAPNETLECKVSRTIQPIAGFVPFPASLQSMAEYRLEWQLN